MSQEGAEEKTRNSPSDDAVSQARLENEVSILSHALLNGDAASFIAEQRENEALGDAMGRFSMPTQVLAPDGQPVTCGITPTFPLVHYPSRLRSASVGFSVRLLDTGRGPELLSLDGTAVGTDAKKCKITIDSLVLPFVADLPNLQKLRTSVHTVYILRASASASVLRHESCLAPFDPIQFVEDERETEAEEPEHASSDAVSSAGTTVFCELVSGGRRISGANSRSVVFVEGKTPLPVGVVRVDGAGESVLRTPHPGDGWMMAELCRMLPLGPDACIGAAVSSRQQHPHSSSAGRMDTMHSVDSLEPLGIVIGSFDTATNIMFFTSPYTAALFTVDVHVDEQMRLLGQANPLDAKAIVAGAIAVRKAMGIEQDPQQSPRAGEEERFRTIRHSIALCPTGVRAELVPADGARTSRSMSLVWNTTRARHAEMHRQLSRLYSNSSASGYIDTDDLELVLWRAKAPGPVGNSAERNVLGLSGQRDALNLRVELRLDYLVV